MNSEQRQTAIRKAVNKIEAIDKSLPPVERIILANEIIAELDKELFPDSECLLDL